MRNYLYLILVESLSARNIHRTLFGIVLVTIMGYPFFASVAGVFAFNYCVAMVCNYIFESYNDSEASPLKAETA